ncbi:MAG: alpha-amylase family protein [Anaerolineae bacterium]|nr:alpha-amylase family protein [Anaerolineae bacterium]NUQ02496.1 amylosucrase [Anaerolineae bacterium]
MSDNPAWFSDESVIALERIRPLLDAALETDSDRARFFKRLEALFPTIFEMFLNLYGWRYDCHYHLERTLVELAHAFRHRSTALRIVDEGRESNPGWFTGEQMVGAVCYVDLFARDLPGLRSQLPYLKELGVTYLHLMPLFKSPETNSDGGYAVSSFREVDPRIGTMKELEDLAGEFRAHGISIVVDFVFNHTSDEHEWAKRALQGDKRYQAYYRMFDDRSMPDAYEPQLREIFPDQSPGSFSFRPEINKWVWTTFNSFQWDLNYANPEVFRAMLAEMLFLANRGADVLRLDAVPFVWKEPGTNCENLPGVHWILRAFNALTRVAAPGLLFKSEAIVHPRDVRSYMTTDKCQISYNPILMSHLWDALATREIFMMRHAMQHRFALPDGCTWVNYVRSHDDIGWGFADEDAASVGINGRDHRYFLNQYYIGRFTGSFARGMPFNYNPRTQDMRISGTTASLAGLERAIQSGDVTEMSHSIRRILLVYGVVLSIGGIPLLYLGDELATLNDYSFQEDLGKAGDSRWIHRPAFSVERWTRRDDKSTPEGAVYQSLLKMIRARTRTPAFAGADTDFFDVYNKHIFAYLRSGAVLVLANFSEYDQTVAADALLSIQPNLADGAHDLIADQPISLTTDLAIPGYGLLWLDARKRE